jgi:hypothetical protein
MSKLYAVGALVALLALGACDSRGGSALLGGVGGAAAGAGGYEYHLNQEKQRVEKARTDGSMSADEARIRLDQISRDSFIQ